MRVNDQQVTFNMFDAIKSLDDVKYCNFISGVNFAIEKRLTSYSNNKEIKAAVVEKLEDEKLETANISWLRAKQPFKISKQFESLDLLNFLLNHPHSRIKTFTFIFKICLF